MNSINSAIPSSLLTESKDQHYKTKDADKAGSDQSDSVKKVKPERFIKPSKCLNLEDHEKKISNYRVDFEKQIKQVYIQFIASRHRVSKETAESAVRLSEEWNYMDYKSILNILMALDIDDHDISASDVWFHRNQSIKYTDLQKMKIGNNPIYDAAIEGNDFNKLGIDKFTGKTRLLPDKLPVAFACQEKFSPDSARLFLPKGGLNVLVSTEKHTDNKYRGGISIRINLSDVIKAKGSVYEDSGAQVMNAVMIAMPDGVEVPFEVVRINQ